MSNLSTQTPVQIDTALAELLYEESKARRTLDSMNERVIQRREADASGKFWPYSAPSEEEVREAHSALAAVIAKIGPLEAEYERRPWRRYWHVTNANGHIHTSQSCTSCFPDTQYGWRTDLSGLTDVEVVEREAYNACSVCMPIAPAEQKAARERYNREQREARKAEREAKADEKAEKAYKRAVKHAEKVAKALCELTGEPEVFEAVAIFDRDWSQYGHDGRKNLYDATIDLPTMVGNTLSYIKATQEGERRPLFEANDATKRALREKGMI